MLQQLSGSRIEAVRPEAPRYHHWGEVTIDLMNEQFVQRLLKGGTQPEGSDSRLWRRSSQSRRDTTADLTSLPLRSQFNVAPAQPFPSEWRGGSRSASCEWVPIRIGFRLLSSAAIVALNVSERSLRC